MKKRNLVWALLLSVSLMATACGSPKQDKEAEDVVVSAEQAVTESTQSTQQTSTEQEPGAPDTGVYMDASQNVEVRIEALLSQMTLEEKAAQMVQPEQNGLTPEDVKNTESVLYSAEVVRHRHPEIPWMIGRTALTN